MLVLITYFCHSQNISVSFILSICSSETLGLQVYADMGCSKCERRDSFTCKGETAATCFTEIMRVWKRKGM